MIGIGSGIRFILLRLVFAVVFRSSGWSFAETYTSYLVFLGEIVVFDAVSRLMQNQIYVLEIPHIWLCRGDSELQNPIYPSCFNITILSQGHRLVFVRISTICQRTKANQSVESIGHIPVCRAFSADPFERKNYLIPSGNDDTRVEILAGTDRPNDKKVILRRSCF